MRCHPLCFCTVVTTLGAAIFLLYRESQAHISNDISDVDITQYPYMVSIERQNRHHCAGAIISPRLVLTAAHCFGWFANYSVRAGTTIVGKEGSRHFIKRTIMHPKYRPQQAGFDAAVLEVSPPFQFSHSVRDLRLAEIGDPEPAGLVAELTGWGHTKNPLEESKSLRRVEVHILNEAVCHELDSGRSTVKGISLCGRFDKTSKNSDPYVGDPGAPLVVRGTAVGVASWGLLVAPQGTAPAWGYFEIFIGVRALRPWIDTIIRHYAALDQTS